MSSSLAGASASGSGPTDAEWAPDFWVFSPGRGRAAPLQITGPPESMSLERSYPCMVAEDSHSAMGAVIQHMQELDESTRIWTANVHNTAMDVDDIMQRLDNIDDFVRAAVGAHQTLVRDIRGHEDSIETIERRLNYCTDAVNQLTEICGQLAKAGVDESKIRDSQLERTDRLLQEVGAYARAIAQGVADLATKVRNTFSKVEPYVAQVVAPLARDVADIKINMECDHERLSALEDWAQLAARRMPSIEDVVRQSQERQLKDTGNLAEEMARFKMEQEANSQRHQRELAEQREELAALRERLSDYESSSRTQGQQVLAQLKEASPELGPLHDQLRVMENRLTRVTEEGAQSRTQIAELDKKFDDSIAGMATNFANTTTRIEGLRDNFNRIAKEAQEFEVLNKIVRDNEILNNTVKEIQENTANTMDAIQDTLVERFEAFDSKIKDLDADVAEIEVLIKENIMMAGDYPKTGSPVSSAPHAP